ncbi:hypothetical protein PMAC_001473 [Pneumocystis sp. 'macacae']|nr:hypothetical protein PMAC_001473 [Pneumocystis sp. 'macacae']
MKKKTKRTELFPLKINQNSESKICREEPQKTTFSEIKTKKLVENDSSDVSEVKEIKNKASLGIFVWSSGKNNDDGILENIKNNYNRCLRKSYSNISLRHVPCDFKELYHQTSLKAFDDKKSTVSDEKTDNIVSDIAEHGDSVLFRSLTTIDRFAMESDIETKHRKFWQTRKYPFYSSRVLGLPEKLFLQKWNALKSGIKLKNFKKKDKKDTHISVNLISQLEAATPAVIILASVFQRDDNGRQRVPVLLDQLKINVLDAKNTKSRSHALFQIKLKYGDGEDSVEWSVYKEWKDFLNLHTRYRVSETVNGQFRKTSGLPKFPKSSVPYLRTIRGFSSGNNSNFSKKSNKFSRQNIFTEMESISSITNEKTHLVKSNSFVEMQRRKLEEYLKNMIQLFLFRPEGIKLCLFLELSALGIKLGKSEKYHGKEGLLSVVNSKGSTHKMSCNPIEVRNRSQPKWYLVRESYIVCVSDLSSTKIYDVFLMDDEFEITRKHFSKDISAYISKVKKDNLNRYQPKRHTFKIKNCERQLKLLAKNEITVHQFIENIKAVSETTIWTKIKRFNSFSPIRTNVAAQWIIDGRDYFWNVSRAILNAKETIYIHDWWLSPELYLRRPACISQDWRLDRLLKKKADEGVQIYIIIYRNVGTTVPVDSNYTKYCLIKLSPNIYVQRSPSHLRQNTFFWAHHEKIVCIDQEIGFIGGIDLCFGRWDSYEHVLYDDKPSGWDEMQNPISNIPDEPLIWPGKDYSNPRVQDFSTLDKPYEDMYNRTLVPRMAWHDVSIQVVGQPARDIARHFVQRWNYHLRSKNPSRSMPFLVPPPEFTQEQLEKKGFIGTNELQILRSVGPWSIGTPTRIEHSILNAYVKCIETSEHFVYIENQFFITSSECEGTVIENDIGNALVKRIIKAHKNNEKWRAVIILPLIPGFQSDVDVQEGTSIRLIMHCQYRSICRYKCSIFKKLEIAGINPMKYIRIYSLRNWAKLGNNERLVSEMIYIHAKCMIVDDRISIIGSANINERSMRGNRDSEIAAIIRDTDMQLSTMAGKPYLVGKFSYTLRVRLMREHLGINCDEMEKIEPFMDGLAKNCKWKDVKTWNFDNSLAFETLEDEKNLIKKKLSKENQEFTDSYNEYTFSFQQEYIQQNLNKDGILYQINSNIFEFKEKIPHILESPQIPFGRPKVTTTTTHLLFGVEVKKNISNPNNTNNSMNNLNERCIFTENYKKIIPELQNIHNVEKLDELEMKSHESIVPNLCSFNKVNINTDKLGLNNSSKKKTECRISSTGQWPKIKIDPKAFSDPLSDHFFEDIWDRIAQKNTEIYREVFRCMPDNEVRTWKDYYRYKKYAERFMHRYETEKANINSIHENSESLPIYYQETKLSVNRIEEIDNAKNNTILLDSNADISKEICEINPTSNSQPLSNFLHKKSFKNSEDIFLEPQEILEEKLSNIQGHLVIWPTEWLVEEYEQ